jgi:1-acyl-sn-glycerol-3-phosphate acyltransferase
MLATKAFVKKPGIVDISIGKAISSVGRQPEELMKEVEDWIESEMRRLDPEAYTAGPTMAVAHAHPHTDQDIDA